MIEVVSINVKRPHALLECKEMLVVISTSFKVDYCLIYERGSQAVSFSFFFLIIVSSFIKIVWKADKRFFQ